MNSSTSSSDLKRFLLRIVLPFLLVVIPVCWIGDRIFAEKIVCSPEIEGPSKIRRMMNHVDPDEWAFIGNSRTLNSFIPDSFTTNGWNYGINGAGFGMLQFMLNQELTKKKTAPLIVGLDLNFFTGEFGNPAHFLSVYQNQQVKETLKRYDKNKRWYAIPLLRYFGTFEKYTQRYLTEERSSLTGCTHSKGALLCSTNRVEEVRRTLKGQTWNYQPDTSYLRLATELLERNQGRKIFIVTMPYMQEFRPRVSLSPSWENFLIKIDLLPNVEVIRYDDQTLPDEWFNDFTHMSFVGAKEFSSVCSKIIKEKLSISH